MKCANCGLDCSQDSLFCHNCGHRLAGKENSRAATLSPFGVPGPGLVPGKVFAGRYRILEEVGRGGMGRIYKVEDLELATVVALKIIRPEYLNDPGMIRRFKKEILLAREISHPNVVRIHDFGESDGIQFITMQYVQGESLRELIRKVGPLGHDAVISIATQLLDGLAAAHEHSILHRDLKPHNIMVTEQGDVVITDFGLAKSLLATDGSVSGTLVGTPQYIPPEHWRGQSLTAAADIYAFGVILFEMLTGHCPFQTDSDLGYLQKHLHSKPEFTKAEADQIPVFLRRLVLRCLEKRPQHRYPDVITLLNDLNAGVYTSRPLGSRVAEVLKVQKPLIIVALVILAVLVPTLIKRMNPAGPEKGGELSRQSLAVLYFENETGEKALDRWRSALPDLLITDLAQSRFIRVIPENRLMQVMQRIQIRPEGPYTADTLQKLGSILGINHFITGSFTRAGNRYRVNLRILDPDSGDILFTESTAGTGEACFFPIVDELTRRVKSRFGFSPSDLQRDIDREIGKITTSSPEAMKFYVMGQQYFRKGQFSQSIEAYRNAIREDPEFALAFRAIAESYGYMDNPDGEKENIQKSLELLDRVSQREQLMIRGYAANAINRDFRKAARIYTSLLEVYPEDEDAGIYLGAMLRNLGDFEAARRCFTRVIEKSPDHQLALLNLLYISRVQGNYEQALRLLQEHGSHESNPGFTHYWTSVILTCRQRLEEARPEILNALKVEPLNSLYRIQAGNLCQLLGDLDEAESHYRQLLEPSNIWERVKGYMWLARLEAQRGRFREAGRLFNQGLDSLRDSGSADAEKVTFVNLVFIDLMAGTDGIPSESRHFLESIVVIDRNEYTPKLLAFQGLHALQAQQIDRARKCLEKLNNLPEGFFGTTHLSFRNYLAACLAEAEGNLPEAVTFMENALLRLENQSGRFDEHAFFFYYMSRLYRKANLRRKAMEMSQRILELNYGRLSYGRIYLLTHYLLARDYQAVGWEGKALECYRDFLDLCRQGDVNPQWVRQARLQVERLGHMAGG